MSYTLAYTGAEIDALLGKIDAIFVAEYGSTIYSEVTAAIAAGNKVIVANAGKVYVYAGQDDNSGYVFTQSGPNAAKPNATYVTLSTGNVWSTATVDLATLQQFYASLMEDTASGSIASFPDGAENVPVKELTADIEPIQDLHGYDNPWPDGGNKNLMSVNDATISHDGFIFNTAITLSANQAYTISAKGSTSRNIAISLVYEDDTGSGDLAVLVVSSSGRTSATFTPTKNTKAIRGYAGDAVTMSEIQVEAGSSMTSYVPYSNICPISGYTGAEIPVNGNNLCNWKINTTSADPLEIYLKPNTYRIEASAAIASGNWYVRMTNASGEYFANADMGLDGWSRASSGWAYGGAAATGVTFTVPSGCALVEIGKLNADGTIPAMLNIGSSALPYEPYNGTVYSVSWTDEGTVYKGTAQYKGGGEWEITNLVAADDMGDLTWTYNSSNQRMVATLPTSAESTGGGRSVKDLLSSMFEADITSDIGDNGKMFRNGQNIYVYTDETDPDAFQTAVTGQTLLYPLATPVTFTVNGPDPETLLGDNNIWANTGDISVKYRANTALYIEKKLGE